KAGIDTKPSPRPNHRASNAGVSGGSVQNRLSWSQGTAGLAFENHARGGAILDGSAGILPLGFCPKLHAGGLDFYMVQTHQWRPPDEVEDRGSHAISRIQRGGRRGHLISDRTSPNYISGDRKRPRLN